MQISTLDINKCLAHTAAKSFMVKFFVEIRKF